MILPAHIEHALRLIGVVPAKVPPHRPAPAAGTWYLSEDDIPH